MAKIPKQLLRFPSGFPELGPAAAIEQARMIDIIRRHYERAGFVPLETSIVERPEILTKKAQGELRTQMYGLRLLNPGESSSDKVDLALRFDLTVPLARFVAEHYRGESYLLPFRRYAIGPSFRGEQPKDGRYRQFTQADIDVIGENTLHPSHDAEMVDIVVRIFNELDVGPFVLRMNNRKVLDGFLRSAGCSDKDQEDRARAAVDGIDKVGYDETRSTLESIGLSKEAASSLIATISEQRSTDDTLKFLDTIDGPEFGTGIGELRTLVENVRKLRVPEQAFRIDLSLARGLDYYTGTVYEMALDAYPDLSVVGGGRYDNLVSHFIDTEMPGVGLSIGVTRLVLRLLSDGRLKARARTIAPVLVTSALGPDGHGECFAQAQELRAAGIGAETYLQPKSLGAQIHFADKRGFKLVVIMRQDHLEKGTVVLRHLATGHEEEILRTDLVEKVASMLN